MKRRSIKTVITILLALALLLCGCAKQGKDGTVTEAQTPAPAAAQPAQSAPQQTAPAQPEKQEPPYAAPHSTGKTYVPKNSISIDQFQEAADGPDDHYEGYYVQIDGLRDENIEARVNQRLKAFYEEVRDEDGVPDMEGLRARVAALDYTRHEEYISVNIMASIGNFISVTCNHSETFGGDSWLTYDEVRSLNLDLNTGNEIKFTDLFADDVHAQGVVQEAVDRAVQEGERRMQEGEHEEEEGYVEYMDDVLYLKPGQDIGYIGDNGDLKFYVSDYTGDMMIVFDHETPQFETGSSYYVITVPMEGRHAYDQRFYNGENIYETEEQAFCLFARSLSGDAEYVYDSELEVYNDIEITYGTAHYEYKDLPQAWNDYLILTPEQKDAMKLQERTFVDQVFREGWGPDYLWASADYSCFAERYGNFTVLKRDIYYTVSYNSPDFFQNLRSRDYYCSQLYYGEETEPLELKDLFAEGVDYKTVLRNAIKQSIDANEPEYGYDEARMQAWLRFVLDDITGFYPSTDSLTLIFDNVYEHAVDYFPDDGELWKFTSGSQNISYDFIGYENLNIFR